MCELCKQPYSPAVADPAWVQRRSSWLWPVERLTQQVLAATRAPSVPQLLLRCAAGAASALAALQAPRLLAAGQGVAPRPARSQAAAHRPPLTGRRSQAAAHRPPLTGRRSQAAAPRRRLWKSYVWASGALGAVRFGGRGLRAGLSLGRHLVEEQAGLLAHCLASMTALLGSPYAELLWCQVGAAPGAAPAGLRPPAPRRERCTGERLPARTASSLNP